MIITDIVEVTGTKAKVCVDNGVTFMLYKGEIQKFSLEKDGLLPEELYDKIINEILLKRAKLRCMNLLKNRDYTMYQLVAKLRQGGYPEAVIEGATAYVASFGYIDDFRYARTYIMSAGQTKSRRQIERDLLQKGISKEQICAAYAQCSVEEDTTQEQKLIEKLLEKKRFDSQNATYADRQKIAAFLYRKGFSMDDINHAIGAVYK
ncbi:MAG: regulatory protein RecX [Lachnospiraceae bacterium]|jgi:regulatory protein|nr:regulatory protein RecX [Lachnospiraceae bacterium]